MAFLQASTRMLLLPCAMWWDQLQMAPHHCVNTGYGDFWSVVWGRRGRSEARHPFLCSGSLQSLFLSGEGNVSAWGWFAVSLLGPSQLRASVYLSVAMPCVDPDSSACLSQHLRTTLFLRFQAMELALYGHSKVVFDFLKKGGKICVT